MIKFQVVISDRKDYIIDYRNFNWDELESMINFIDFHATSGNSSSIKITKWDSVTGERI